MSSFTRQDYRRVFEIGRMIWIKHQRRPFGSEAVLGYELMAMVEEAIGRQNIPAKAREVYETIPVSLPSHQTE